MIFTAHQLSDPLTKDIEAIFHFKGFMPDHAIERVVPTGHIFLIFELDGLTRQTYDKNTLQPNAEFKEVWISGMHKHHLAISAHQDSEMLVIQFKPGGALPYFHSDIHQLNDSVVPADGLLGAEILALRTQISDVESTNDKFSLVESWLLSRFKSQLSAPDELSSVIEALQAEPAGKYQVVIDAYPNSQKHLIEQFKKYVGLTPKYFHRILRFNDLLKTIQDEQSICWSDVAYQCGFSDQSHFIKEFHHFSGFNPKEFIKQDLQLDQPNFFPLDKG